jgi:hypothetical protein
LQAVLQNEDIVNSAFEILVKQCDKLKYGSDDFVSSESFVKHFYSQFDPEYVQYVDNDESLDLLGFKVLNPRIPKIG